MSELNIEVNGRRFTRDVVDRTHLGDFLREDLRMTGTNLSCEHGVCGACTVLVDGKPVRSCITFASACEGRQVTTIEGYDNDPVMLRLREAFNTHHALQCGFCTPGMLTTSRDIILRLPDADEARVRIELSGNICRCTGYQGITAAVMSVLDALRMQPDPAVEALREAAMQGKAALPPAADAPKPFTGFDATVPSTSTKAPAAPAATPSASTGASAPAAAGKGTNIQGGFEVPFSADQVWAFMADLRAVAGCLPGAVIESQEGDEVKGKIAIKFGPMAAAFNGAATLERDDAAKSAVLRGSGQDSLSQSRAKGDVSYRVTSLSADKARVDVDLLYSLQGPLAQFSRSGLVQDFVKRMIADFGRNVALRMAQPAGSTEPLPQAEFSPFKMFMSVLWARLKRMLGGQ
ncbi:2Fe-2S iron-sulfur cluster-binding protein [Pusillimonas sp. NJUB218]|uniref:xanthine dehydrogenase family Fe-S subunit n=1 Tax=Pusillimonas sp. NJUB218 TaxID=2023230 RepID=UPI000F4C3FA8|nr:2Fe-2S iron-sulfur cluster-binding protein [Pusillimonas sp. NJUB218]ROT45685.1 carbon monoxide dehydrogenase [Pusillimonas sp. NJUB218]